MKTNVGIETSDQEREQIAQTLGLNHKLAKRDDIKEAVNEFVQGLIAGHNKNEDIHEPTTEDQHDGRAGADAAEDDVPAGNRQLSQRDTGRPEFVASRGDEPYIHEPKDPELAAACRAVFDNLTLIERKTWEAFYADSSFKRSKEDEE